MGKRVVYLALAIAVANPSHWVRSISPCGSTTFTPLSFFFFFFFLRRGDEITDVALSIPGPHLNWVVGGGDHNTNGGCRRAYIAIMERAITVRIGSPFVHFDLIAASNPILNTTGPSNSSLLERTVRTLPFVNNRRTSVRNGTYLSRKPAVPYWNALTG